MAKEKIKNSKVCNYVGDKKLDNVLMLRARMRGTDKSTLYREIVDNYFKQNPMEEHEKAVYNG